jgi:predicted enzyme related to lactoylglutathione lyase
MERVTGIGGIFFKADDPEKLLAWYETHLGVKPEPEGSSSAFHWRESEDAEKKGMTIWALFPRNTSYFNPSGSDFMVNYRVADLDALLARLKEEGVTVDEKREDTEYGRFAWIMDPEGHRIELWEPRDP